MAAVVGENNLMCKGVERAKKDKEGGGASKGKKKKKNGAREAKDCAMLICGSRCYV